MLRMIGLAHRGPSLEGLRDDELSSVLASCGETLAFPHGPYLLASHLGLAEGLAALMFNLARKNPGGVLRLPGSEVALPRGAFEDQLIALPLLDGVRGAQRNLAPETVHWLRDKGVRFTTQGGQLDNPHILGVSCRLVVAGDAEARRADPAKLAEATDRRLATHLAELGDAIPCQPVPGLWLVETYSLPAAVIDGVAAALRELSCGTPETAPATAELLAFDLDGGHSGVRTFAEVGLDTASVRWLKDHYFVAEEWPRARGGPTASRPGMGRYTPAANLTMDHR